MVTTVYCLANNQDQANGIVGRLQANGFDPKSISVLFPDKSTSKSRLNTDVDTDTEIDTSISLPHQETHMSDGATVGVGAGAVIGAGFGWFLSLGSLFIPGVGPFIAAGPIFAMLGGAAVGAVFGGISGALIGVGIPEDRAEHYEKRIHAGHVLVSVHVSEDDRIEIVKRIYLEEGAQDIGSSEEPDHASISTKSSKQ